MSARNLIASLFMVGMPLAIFGPGCAAQVATVGGDGGPYTGGEAGPGGGATCATDCARFAGLNLPCEGGGTTNCTNACTSLEQQCKTAGQGNAFQSYLNCAASASVSCNGTNPVVSGCDSSFVSRCTGGPPVDGGGRDTGGPPPNDSGVPPIDTGVRDTGGPPPPIDSGGPCTLGPADCTCDANPSGGACVMCCQMNHQGGTSTFINAVMSCGCGAPCGAQCAATYCASPPANPDAGCNACLQGALAMNGACYNPVVNACNADQDCIAYLNCANGCPNTP